MTIKNLLCVPLLRPDVPEDLAGKYWQDVDEQVTRLEKDFGQVCKLYHEANYLDGEGGLKNLKLMNEKACRLIDNRADTGVTVQALEDKETFFKIFDCQTFLNMRFSSKEVMEKLSAIVQELLDIYNQSVQKRLEHIPQQISGTLAEGETGVLIMREDERMKVQFPPEVNVILVTSPVLSEIEKWYKEHQPSGY